MDENESMIVSETDSIEQKFIEFRRQRSNLIDRWIYEDRLEILENAEMPVETRLKELSNLSAVNIDPFAAGLAHTNLKAHHLTAKIHPVSATAMTPLKDESVDYVISSYMIHHIRSASELVKMFKEVWRVLRPGGGYVLSDIHRCLTTPLWMLLGGLFCGATRTVLSDGVQSSRRAYRLQEINFILEIAKSVPGFDMRCQRYHLLPFWFCSGIKK